jgi:ABC-2 type transport system ATP-binding protein
MILEIKNVSKYFQGKPAVDRVNITLEGPLICGLLGRNGAGKTTLMNMISGKLFPTIGASFWTASRYRKMTLCSAK